MSMGTNLKGRLRNTTLSLNNVLMPVFEAVVNAIHTIDDTGLSPTEGQIRVKVIREDDAQVQLSSDIESTKGVPVALCVSDNGIGFTDKNMRSFNELDSDYKQARGGRGMGRLLWLKAFQGVAVESVFQDGKTLYRRCFDFNEENGVCHDQLLKADDNAHCGTTVFLKDLRKRYWGAIPKKIDTIARDIFEHCLGYYLRPEGVPNIAVQDTRNNTVSLNDIYARNLAASLATEAVMLKGQEFKITHAHLRKTSMSPRAYFCVNERSVFTLDLSKEILGFFGKFEDREGIFYYVCYVTSPFLEEHLLPDRTGFDIPEKKEGLFQDIDISFEEIKDVVLEKVEQRLNSYLEVNRKESYQNVVNFVETKAPHYRSLLGRMRKENLYLPMSCPEQEIELSLHREKARIEEEFLQQEQTINAKFDSDSYDEEEFTKDLALIADFKKSDLAQYVAHRNYVLKILRKLISRTDTGKYALEGRIHQLIMPMGKDSNEVSPDECNLWVIDEKLAFHHYLSSDKPFSAIPNLGLSSKKKPDLLKFDIFNKAAWVGDSSNLNSITIIEFKRPMRNDMKEGEVDPIKQMRDYVKLIRSGEVYLPDGRPLNNSDKLPGFCYAICDLTPSMKTLCVDYDLTPTYDGMGYFGYHDKLAIYTEVISYDKLLKDAFQRNQAFFQKLGLSNVI